VWQPDPTLEIDVHQVTQPGVRGTKKRTIRITYENGRETRRAVDREWIDAAPITHVNSYGTKIVHRELTLPTGQTITYWRKVRMLATSYTAATSGKARTHPEFGVTATGMRAGAGIVAVDPRVVNLRSRVYVPGYGVAVAGDTGGRILGRRVDLGYDEANLVLWYTWVDVYLLDPPPPSDQIRWIIPDTPRERSVVSR
jgi:3D (Asp-Asp-Asp) domain-containing protein